MRFIEMIDPKATLLDINNFTNDTGKFWYWQNNYQHTQKMLDPILDMHIRYFKRIAAASYDELQTWIPVSERVDTTKFPYFKISMEQDKNWRYPFTSYQGRQQTGNGRTMFSLRHAPDIPKTCVHVFDKICESTEMERLHTSNDLIDKIESTPYWKNRLLSIPRTESTRTWRLVYTPDLGLYWIDCIFSRCMEGDWFHKPSGHDQAVWKMTIDVVKRFDQYSRDNVLDIIDMLIDEGVPLVKNWNPEDF